MYRAEIFDCGYVVRFFNAVWKYASWEQRYVSLQHCPLPFRSTRTLQSSSVTELPCAMQMGLSYSKLFYKCEALHLMHKDVHMHKETELFSANVVGCSEL